MSKSYGLPGLRLGWLALRDRDALARIVELEHYTTICSSAPRAAQRPYAQAPCHARGTEPGHRVRQPAAPGRFLRNAGTFSWVRLDASPIGFSRLLCSDDTSGFCERLVAQTGVLLLPGTVNDEPGHVRSASAA